MPVIEIPFSPRMATSARAGQKCATTRSERMGNPGDIFEIKGEWFRLLDVKQVTLLWVRNEAFRIEGFDSPEKFEKTWRSLHRGHFSVDKEYFIHFFAGCERVAPEVQKKNFCDLCMEMHWGGLCRYHDPEDEGNLTPEQCPMLQMIAALSGGSS